jgi:hypothetical protein
VDAATTGDSRYTPSNARREVRKKAVQKWASRTAPRPIVEHFSLKRSYVENLSRGKPKNQSNDC